MYDHIGLKVRDIEAAVRFYTAALAPLGHVVCSKDAASASFGPTADQPALWLYAGGKAAGTTHVCFRARTRGEVGGFHEAGRAAGGKDNGPPAVRTDYSPDYYAAFLLDPDGNNVEALCLRT